MIMNLRTKSILLMMLTGFAALAFAVTAFIGHELLMFRESAENETSAIARIIGLNSMASLSFQDKEAATETLESLNAESNLVSAAIYDKQGRLFAAIARGEEPAQRIDLETASGGFWDGRVLTVHSPIMLEKERLGTVTLVSAQTELIRRLRAYLLISAAIMLASSLVAYGLSVYSQRFIAAPIEALQRTMTTVAETRDYGIRAHAAGTDELGALATRFNAMLDQIEHQDQELRQHREQLEKNVRARTSELRDTITELRAAKARAEEASQAKMQFLANISHEIRTPMNGVLGIAEILSKSPLSERQRQLLLTLRQSGSDLMGIINDLLDFSKLEAGKFDLNMSTFNLYTLLDNCIGVFSASARDKTLEIATIIHPEVPRFIQSDPDRIRQILLNLVANAIKFTPGGSVVLSARLGQTNGNQGRLVIEVRDTGIGILPEAQASIFSPFTQADDTMTRHHGGTGLGLAIVKQLTALLEGAINLDSQPGRGTVFTVTIPFVFPEDMGLRDAAPSLADLRAVTVGLSPLYRQAMDNILSRFGIQAAHHATTKELLIAPPASGRMLFLIDEGQFATDGKHIGQALRGQAGPGSRVVLLTGSAAEPDPDVDFVLTKPPRQSEMHNLLQDIASGAEQTPVEPEGMTEFFDARVLLVEDNEVNQKVAASALEIFGLTIDVAANGLIGLEKATSTHYDLIFMDCQMPIMDGYTATTKIREWEQVNRPGRRVPIVALTAHALSRDRLLCFQRGMDDYVAKPFSLDVLRRCLRQWLPAQARIQAPVGHQEFTPPPADATSDEFVSSADLVMAKALARAPEPTPEGEDAALDATILESLLALQRQGSSDLLNRLFMAYESSTTDLLAGIDQALVSDNLDLVRQNAHTLKSSSHNIGAVTLGGMALNLENAAREGAADLARDIHAQIKGEYERVREAIAARRDAR